jgi:hypothetical protein
MEYQAPEYAFDDRQEKAVYKARTCKTTVEFIKHCHTLIHMCSEALVKFEEDARYHGSNARAEETYQLLKELITQTTCTFEYE